MVLRPKDRAEEVALFRLEIIGQLARMELVRGELRAELLRLSEQRFRPPGAHSTCSYSVPTLERWYYAYRKGGLEALKPKARSDRGFAQGLTPDLKALLLDIRSENTSASVPLILRTLIAEGRLNEATVSASTVRRLYRAHGLNRASLRANNKLGRLSWRAAGPNAIWQGDVCHFGKHRIHGLLDDASRFVVALEAHPKEREQEMLELFGATLYRYGVPDRVYLDNGSTYSGKALKTVCGRLGINLVHSRPYDPQARGKIERFWRTLREDLLNYIAEDIDLHGLNVRLIAWLNRYHDRPHGGLMGKTPRQSYTRRTRPELEALQTAFAIRSQRKVRKDSTLSFNNTRWETDQSHLAGKNVTVVTPALSLGRKDPRPWIEIEGQKHRLTPVDPVANGKRSRKKVQNKNTSAKTVRFEPAEVVLDATMKRKNND